MDVQTDMRPSPKITEKKKKDLIQSGGPYLRYIKFAFIWMAYIYEINKSHFVTFIVITIFFSRKCSSQCTYVLLLEPYRCTFLKACVKNALQNYIAKSGFLKNIIVVRGTMIGNR